MTKKCRVLFVDDELEFLESMWKRLRKRGYEVETAASSSQALAKLAGFAADVVVLDMKMPVTDGIGCLKEIKKRWPEKEIIFLTGHAAPEAGVNGIRLGAFDYCVKPIDLDNLQEKIELAYRNVAKRDRVSHHGANY